MTESLPASYIIYVVETLGDTGWVVVDRLFEGPKLEEWRRNLKRKRKMRLIRETLTREVVRC